MYIILLRIMCLVPSCQDNPWKSLGGKWTFLISVCRDLPPHFIQALRGKGILPTGPGIWQQQFSTLICTSSMRGYHRICITPSAEVCMRGSWIPNIAGRAEAGLQGKRVSASTPREKHHQMVTALSSHHPNLNLYDYFFFSPVVFNLLMTLAK